MKTENYTVKQQGNERIILKDHYLSPTQIIRVDPDTKQLLFTLPVPAHQTTSVAWGGDNYDELYITSANFPDYIPEEERDKYSHNGYLFKATGLGVKGLPPTNAKL